MYYSDTLDVGEDDVEHDLDVPDAEHTAVVTIDLNGGIINKALDG